MTSEEKDLLFKDLCARLPYGVMLSITHNEYTDETFNARISTIDYCNEVKVRYGFEEYEQAFSLEQIKPYLFPLSSMTEEQKKEISKRYNYYNLYQSHVEITNHSEGYWDNDNSCNLQDYLWLEDWFNKNHFDYRGLIPMGLAINATNLNIY